MTFEKYLRLLLDLHKQMGVDDGDTPEADAIRDEMDPYWKKLTNPQRDLLGQVSEALYYDSDVYHE